MLVLDTKGYDVILGMTWLSRYHAVIDCRNKKIIFRIQHQPKFQFDGKNKSAKEKTKSVCATAEIKKEVPVWNKFPDVLKEILGLPLDRAVEFSIDTIPDTVSISKAPYIWHPLN